jgi:hypothetical protein
MPLAASILKKRSKGLPARFTSFTNEPQASGGGDEIGPGSVNLDVDMILPARTMRGWDGGPTIRILQQERCTLGSRGKSLHGSAAPSTGFGGPLRQFCYKELKAGLRFGANVISWLSSKAALVGAAVVTTTFLAASAHAEEPALPPAIAEFVPADAAALVSLRLPEVDDGFAFADLLAGLYPMVARAVSAVRTPLALPAFSETDLSDRGIIAERPTFFSLFRVPAKLPKTAVGFAHRLVVPVSDRPKFLLYAQSVLERLKFSTSSASIKPLPWAKPLAGLAKKQSVELWGFDAVTAQGVSIRFKEHETDAFALIDVFLPDLPKPPGKKAAGVFALGIKATLEQPDIATVASVWNEGTRLALHTKASIVLVVQPNNMVKVLPPLCQTRFSSDAGAFFTDMAITARLNPFDWKVRVSFAPTPANKPFLLKGGSNDGLIDTRALSDAGLGAASLFLDNTADWLNVSRPVVLGKNFEETTKEWDKCGPASMALTIARFWPHLVTGLFAETLDALQAPAVLKSSRNLAVGLRTPPQDETGTPPPPSAMWMASLDSDKQETLNKWLDGRAEAPAENAAFGNRSPRLWTLAGQPEAGVMKSAGVEPLPGTHIGLALSPQPAGLDWYYSEKRRPAVFSNRAALGSLHINIKRLLNLASESADVDTRDAISLATSQISRMGGDLVSNGSLLELDLSLSGGGI